jgi:endonuclease/exonuclease/phosphatase family metal-dependent hydrolase
VFAHYAGYDLALPWRRAHVWTASAVLLVACALLGPPLSAGARFALRVSIIPAALAAALALRLGAQRDPAAPAPASPAPALDMPAQIVTFNLHAGFDEKGDFAFPAMMDSLRAQQADVIALQEVSRGWLINGCADLFELARRALPAAGVFGASVDSDWGNAVFSIAPIARSENLRLPPEDLALTRAVLHAEIPTESAGSPLHVLATHFHHRAADETIREAHSRFLVETFADAEAASVVLGDFNATSGSTSLGILESAGWKDVASLGGAAPTYPSRDPDRRIDTIFVRGADALESRVAPPWGSDHRAVKAAMTLIDPSP